MKPEKQLYQWDTNQSLVELTPSAQFVDYPIGDEVIRIKADGTRCRIPDEVLQTYGGKTCYERYPDGTYRSYSFTVLYAPKPPDYVYTPEERTTFEALTARVDAAIEDIKRRADSGEFTPKKGVDYFTEEDKTELMEGVSSGAIGEFRKVVDSATTEYNNNASEKLTTYDTNAEQHTTDYNRNAEQKLEAYNSNHTEKMAEYNQNAETKTAEFEANIEGKMSEKANVDGYYEEMTVGDAEQLISSMYSENSEPYGYRTTGDSADVGNREYIDKIVGGTVAWNQLVQNVGKTTQTINGVTFTVNSDGTIMMNGTATTKVRYDYNARLDFIGGHTYAVLGVPAGASASTYHAVVTTYNYADTISKFNVDDYYGIRVEVLEGVTVNNVKFSLMCFDLTQMFGSTIADYIYSLEQSQAGAGVAWFKKLFPKDYYEYNAGELLSVGGLQSHDTVGFNAFDIATNKAKLLGGYQYEIVGAYTSASYEDASGNTETLMITNRLFTPTNNGTLTVVGADDTTCVHLVWLGYRNGEYEPYEKHSYQLDNSLTLRGIPKLDASNNLYYDGDEYASDGKVKRKYGIVDLGTLDWISNATSRFYATLPQKSLIKSSYNDYTNVMCANYESKTLNQIYASIKGISTHPLLGTDVWIYDSDYTDATAFKAAMSGVMLVYELATPTTETAEPYNEIQICDDFGTEEFVSTGIVPVGHKTRYPANLRDKLQHLPDPAGMDGTYLIRQTGKQMSLVYMPAVFPETPTEDGTYTLKTVVTGGVATLQWVAK